jgi:hypothetical protein
MRTCMILLAVALATVVVAAAGAAGGQRWADPRDDAAAAPDITDVSATSDDAGTITIEVSVANRMVLDPEDELDVAIDADRQPATGDRGIDYVVGVYSGTTPFVMKWSDDAEDWVDVAAPSYRYAWTNGVATYTIDRRDLGWTAGFELFVVSWDGAGDEPNDYAPSTGDRWTYSLHLPFALRLAPFTAFDIHDLTATSGKQFMLGARVTRDDTGATLHEGKIACTATLAGRKLATSTPGRFFTVTVSSGGDFTQALCTWKLPKTAKGKQLKAAVTVTLNGRSIGRTFTGRVR